MNERKELIERLRLDYTASSMAIALMHQAADMLEADSEPKCSDHHDAPHGFNRNASHCVGRYVCECEGWIPDTLAVRKQALEEAVKVCEAVEHDHLDTYKHKPGPNAYDPHFQGLSMGAGECAEKIGELLTLP